MMNNNLQVINGGVVKPMGFDTSLFNSFVNYIDVKETTMKGYLVCIKHFLKWIQDNSISNPIREDIKSYKAFLETEEFTSGTKARYLRVVKQFFKWTDSEGLYPNVADNIKGAKVKNDNTKKEAFLEEDIRTVLESLDRETVQGKRDYAMILLSVVGGLRIIEMHRANIGDIQTIKGQKVLYIQGKGRDEKDEYTKLIPEVSEAIDNYLKTRTNTKKTDPLFTGTSNRAKDKRLSVPSFSVIIKGVFKSSGFDCDKLTAHSLRHTSNTLLFKSGADLYTVQKHARHSDPKTTEIYIHQIDREKDKSEELIYRQIFSPSEDSPLEALKKALETLSEEQTIKVLNYIKTLD